jgi:hypothetical protein
MHELLAIYPGISNQSTILMHFYRAALYSIDFVRNEVAFIFCVREALPSILFAIFT